MFPPHGLDWAILGVVIGTAAAGAGLIRLLVRSLPNEEQNRVGATHSPTCPKGCAARRPQQTITIAVPQLWCGRQDVERARRVAGIMQLVLRRMAPQTRIEVRFTIDTWEWRYGGDPGPQLRHRLDMALQLLALRWKRNEDDVAAGKADPARRLAEWERLATSLPAHHGALTLASFASTDRVAA